MLQQLISLFMSFIAFFMSLFGFGGGGKTPEDPTPVPGPEVVYLSETTLSYGADQDQTLDLFLPAGKTGAVGLVLFLFGHKHGGGVGQQLYAGEGLLQERARLEGLAQFMGLPDNRTGFHFVRI